jgi:protein SCO1/2
MRGLSFFYVLALAEILAGCTTPQRRACCQPEGQAENQAAGNINTNLMVDLRASWQDDEGQAFQLASLHGQPVVISMFYATCEGVCVITKNDLKQIEASLPPKVRRRTAYVLVTLDPANDTMAVLKRYRFNQGLAPQNWRLLRGSPGDTARLAAVLGIGFGRDGAGLIRHSSQLVVLDGKGRIVRRQDGIHADLDALAQVVTAAAQN